MDHPIAFLYQDNKIFFTQFQLPFLVFQNFNEKKFSLQNILSVQSERQRAEPKSCVGMDFFLMKQGQCDLYIERQMTATVTPPRYFQKIRQIQKDIFVPRAFIGEKFYIINHSQIIYRWMANFMLIIFCKIAMVSKCVVFDL